MIGNASGQRMVSQASARGRVGSLGARGSRRELCLGWRAALALALALHRLRRRSRGLEKQRTSAPSTSEDSLAICARPASCCLADSKDSSSLSNAIQPTARRSYYPSKGTRCLWSSSSRYQMCTTRLGCLPEFHFSCHLCRDCLLLTIGRWTSVKTLFRGSSPSVRGAGAGRVTGEITYSVPYICTWCTLSY